MTRLVLYELLKTFWKKRTYLGFAVVLVIVPVVEVAFKLEGGRFLTVMLRGLARDFYLVGNLFNGWLISFQIMNSLWFHIPLLISFVAGDQLAGEATSGTYRLILTRPTSRSEIFVAKWITTIVYTVLFVAFLAVLSIGLALALLGRGDLLVIGRGTGILILPGQDVAWRFILAYIFAGWSMLTISSISLFFSSFVENAIGPIVATMGVLIVSTVLSVLPVEVLASLRGYLFTSYMDLWLRAFADPISWDRVREAVLVLGGYSAASVLGAWLIFVRKDILS